MVTEDEIQRKLKQRISAFRAALLAFQSSQGGARFGIVNNAHIDLGNSYWTLHEKDIRCHVMEYSSRFKMASLTEKTIFLVQPFRLTDGTPAREFNALFAFTSALVIIKEMRDNADADQDEMWDAFASNGHVPRPDLFVFCKDQSYHECLSRSIDGHLLWLETHDRRTDGGFSLLHNSNFLDLLWHSIHLKLNNV